MESNFSQFKSVLCILTGNRVLEWNVRAKGLVLSCELVDSNVILSAGGL